MRTLILLASLLLAGCTVARVEEPSRLIGLPHDIHKMAMAAGGAHVVGDALAIELAGRGHQILDQAQAGALIVTSKDDADTIKPEDMQALQKAGVDALIVCHCFLGRDGKANTATVKVLSTHTGSIIAGATWINGESDNDATREDISVTAKALANALDRQLARGEKDYTPPR